MKNSTPSASISRNIAAASSLAGSESTHCERSHSRPHLPRARGVKVSARNNTNGELQQQHLPLFPRAPRCPTARRTPAALDAASGARIPVRNVRVARRPCLAGRRCELSLHCELTGTETDRNRSPGLAVGGSGASTAARSAARARHCRRPRLWRWRC